MKKWKWGILFMILVAACVIGCRAKEEFSKQEAEAQAVRMEEIRTAVKEFRASQKKAQEQETVSESTDEPTVTVDITSTPTDTELLPTMDSPSTAKNRVWVGTFQLVWNDLMNELIKGPVDLPAPMVKSLNKQSFTTADLSESAYYKKWGEASPELRKEIGQGLKEKFNETSDVLDRVQWTQPSDSQFARYILYAMLKKEFSFVKKFDKLENEPFTGSEGLVKYFGINARTPDDVRQSVRVLFYNDSSDFAVQLTSNKGDEVYLYYTGNDKTLDQLYKDMLHKEKRKTDWVQKEDYLKIPMIDFNLVRKFREVTNQPFYAKNIGAEINIEEAFETAQFKMDEAGVRLKSEAIVSGLRSMGANHDLPKHRYFFFNSIYVMFIQEKGKKPYFAMRVTDAKALQ